MPHPVSIRAAAATSRVRITMQRTFTRARYAPLPRRRRLAQPIPTRNPLLVPAGSVCRLPSPPLGGVAAAKHPLQAVNHRSPRIAAPSVYCLRAVAACVIVLLSVGFGALPRPRTIKDYEESDDLDA